jgi:hypothetical protein
VAVTPGERTLPVGEIAQFQATLTYNNGAVVESAANVIWSSSSTIAIEDDKGTFQTNQEGLATITATLGSKTGSATLSILTDLSDFDEFVPELELDTLPNCGTLIPTDSSQGFAAQWAWCNRAVPPTDTIERNRIRDATAAIRAIGGVCVELANVIDSIMANNLLRIDHRKRGEIPYVAWTSRGDRGGSAMVLRGELVSTWYDNTPLAHLKGTWVTLQWALAHEADHATGASHTDHPTNMTTPRSNFCSGTAHLAPPP